MTDPGRIKVVIDTSQRLPHSPYTHPTSRQAAKEVALTNQLERKSQQLQHLQQELASLRQELENAKRVHGGDRHTDAATKDVHASTSTSHDSAAAIATERQALASERQAVAAERQALALQLEDERDGRRRVQDELGAVKATLADFERNSEEHEAEMKRVRDKAAMLDHQLKESRALVTALVSE